MKILLDLGHPAHIHYFKNFIKIMKCKGHEIRIIAREKEVLHQLLNEYGFEYISRGKGARTLLGKILYLFYADFIIYKIARSFQPDIFLSFASPYLAHVSKLVRKPHIAFDDTEHAFLTQSMYLPFTDYVLTPKYFKKDYNRKQIRFSGIMDLAYLHPKYFKPNSSNLERFTGNGNRPNVFLRFVGWHAAHDRGYDRLSIGDKIQLVNKLLEVSNICISSEEALPVELEQYRYRLAASRIHDYLSNCGLFIGDSGSMATEAAVLGVPSIFCNSAADQFGVIDYLSNLGLIHKIQKYELIIKKSFEILSNPEQNQNSSLIQERLLKDNIDVTSFMVWFIENFPSSVDSMRLNPGQPI